MVKKKKTESHEFRFIDIPRALWYLIDPEQKKFLFFSILLMLANLFEFAPPLIIGIIVDFLTGYKTGDTLNPLFIFLIILVFSSGIIAILRLRSKQALGDIGINARYRAKVKGFEKLLNFSLSWHHQEGTGNKAQRILTGSEAIRLWIIDFNNFVIPAVTAFAGSLIACLLLHPVFALFFIYYISILFTIEVIFDRKISKISDRINKSMENASGTFVESTANILAVKALGAKKRMTDSVERREQIARTHSSTRLKYGVNKWILIQIHNSISWGIYILITALLVINGKLSIGLVLTYTQYFARLRRSSTQFTNQFQTMIERKSALGRMMPYFWNDYSLHKGDSNFPEKWSNIEISEANFGYENDSAISNLNLSIKRGEKIGIAGQSGSGKSTLIKLFLGLYHLKSGSFLIDNVKIEDIKHDTLTSNISVVLQETELFNLSLRDNITMMRESDTLDRACRIACIDELIINLPMGLDTVIGERGYALSGGERQRVGIARAVYRDTPLLLLDEATSALDSTTEKKIMESLLGEYSREKTMLIIAHRISTLKNTDRIIVFEDGNIVEKGTFEELKGDRSTRFGAMYAVQAAQD